jgi:hypothetical protein
MSLLTSTSNKLMNLKRKHIQGLDKIIETLQILYTFHNYYGARPPFALSTAAILLGMDSYKF